MNKEIQIFKYQQDTVRSVMIDGIPYFVGRDIANQLGYKNPNKAISDHCRKKLKVMLPNYKDGKQINSVKVWVIPEPDVFRLIARCKLPQAEAFEDWIFEDVLPQINQSGMYVEKNLLDEMLANPDKAIKLLSKQKEVIEDVEHYKEQINVLNEKINELEIYSGECEQQVQRLLESNTGLANINQNLRELIDSKTQEFEDEIAVEKDYNKNLKKVISKNKMTKFVKQIVETDAVITTTQIAKDYGMSAVKFNRLLHEMGIQFKINGQWVLYSKYQDKHFMESYTGIFGHDDKVKMGSKWTHKGRLFIHNLLRDCGIYSIKENYYSKRE